MNSINNLRITKTFKYLALYPRLGFFEESDLGIYTKKYSSGYIIDIYTSNQQVNFHNGVNVINGEFTLDNPKAFVILECVNKLLDMGYSQHQITIDLDNEYDIFATNLYIRCFDWDEDMSTNNINKSDKFFDINYQSRLMSGLIERKYSVSINNELGNYGVFENEKLLKYYKISHQDNESNKIKSSTYWDRQDLTEFTIEDNITNIGGDTFYNCANLKKVIIGKNVKEMGNNPFAGCPNLELINNSPYFVYENDALYNKDKTILIYFNLNSKLEKFEIPNTVKMVGKHAFYLSKLKEIVIPDSVLKLENNPFSGCEDLHLINHSKNYEVIDDIIYTSDRKILIGALKSIKTHRLEIPEGVESISRNSFWNCQGIYTVVLPHSLREIGYNPFVGCSNIEFECNSMDFHIHKGMLYNSDFSTLICCPRKVAVGEVHILDMTHTLGRGAFSGCDLMNNIHLRNVTVIGKSCFTNCTGLTKLIISDFVTFIGEWAFGHCSNLKELSVYKDTFLDEHILLNTNAKLTIRNDRSNMVVESENIQTLRSLNESYQGKIDYISIDPPYNSKVEGISYKDNYYDVYKFFIEIRCQLAYKLLSDNGVMSINIDKGEKQNTIDVLKEIFKTGKVTVHKWKKLHPYFDKNRDVAKGKKRVLYEYIIIARKNKNMEFNPIKQPYIKHDVLLEKDSKFPKVFDCFGTNSSAKDEIKELFNDRKYFSTPKPVKLMQELVRGCSNKNSIILDFFAGSGTIGHAVENLNREDNGNRKYILVSNNESNICKRVTKARMEIIGSEFTFID